MLLSPRGVRLQLPIPGTGNVGLEIPRNDPQRLTFEEVVNTDYKNPLRTFSNFVIDETLTTMRLTFRKNPLLPQIDNPKNLKDETTTEKKDDIENRPLEKQNFNWCKFLGYLICCGRTDKKMSYYEDFRSKLISEENIIQNYLDTYKLLKHCCIKKTVFNDKDE